MEPAMVETVPESVETFEIWFRKACDTKQTEVIYYAVVDKASGLVGGYLALRDYNPILGYVEIGLHYGPLLARRRGATEAFYLCASYIFDTLGFNRLGWLSNNQNAVSKKAARRLGFTFEGIGRIPRVHKNGHARDMTLWGMLREVQWPAMKRALELWLVPENFDEAGMQRRRLEDIRDSEGWKPDDLGMTPPDFESITPTKEDAMPWALVRMSGPNVGLFEGRFVRLERLTDCTGPNSDVLWQAVLNGINGSEASQMYCLERLSQ